MIFTKKEFSGDKIIAILYPYGFSFKSINITPYLLKCFPRATDAELLNVKNTLRKLQEKEYIYVADYTIADLGTSTAGKRHELGEFDITVSLKQDGLEYYRKIEPRWWKKQLVGWISGLIIGFTVGVGIQYTIRLIPIKNPSVAPISVQPPLKTGGTPVPLPSKLP